MSFDDLLGLSGKRIAITGATGFIGARVLAGLRTAGADACAIVRSARSAARLSDDGVETNVATLHDRSALERALSGADALVHLAYDMRAGAEENLADFDALLAAAEDAAINRIVHISSVVVYDDWPNADIDEDSPVGRPGGGPYRAAKIAMEQRLMESRSQVAILQPTLVYGPRSAMWTDQLAAALSEGGLVLPEPDGMCNAVYVDDVAQAVLRALICTDLGQERFLVSGMAPVAWSDLLTGYAQILDGRLIREPADALRTRLGPKPEEVAGVPLAARISRIGRRALGHDRFEALVAQANKLRGARGSGPMFPDHHLLDLFTAKGSCSIERAGRRLGYVPEFDLAAGLAATAPYLRQRYGAAVGTEERDGCA